MGGPRDGSDFQNLHRNKRSMTLNLKAPEGLAAFKRMVKKADVLVENFRPDVKKRLGIDYKTLAQDQSAPGLCQHFRLRPGRALCRPAGLRPDRAGHGRADVDHRPARAGAGARRHSGRRSQRRACSPRSAFSSRCWSAKNPARARRSRPRCLQAQIFMLDFQAARYLVERRGGEAGRQQSSDQHPDRRVQDARRLHQHRHHRRQDVGAVLPRRSGREALAAESGLSNGRRRARRIATRSTPRSRRYLQSRTSAEWVERFNKAGVPCGPIYSIDQVFADPQVRASRHRAERRRRRQSASSAWSASRCRCRARRRASRRRRRSSASIPMRCSRNSAFPRARSPRCTRPERCRLSGALMGASQ